IVDVEIVDVDQTPLETQTLECDDRHAFYFAWFQDDRDAVTLAQLLKIGLHPGLAANSFWRLDDDDATLLRLALKPVVVVEGDLGQIGTVELRSLPFAQQERGHPTAPIGIKKPGNTAVEDHAVKAGTAQGDVALMVFLEAIHGGPPGCCRQRRRGSPVYSPN